jgi:uncharacterized membrane protein (UPF0127 family)
MHKRSLISILPVFLLTLAACGGPKSITLVSSDGAKRVVVQAEIADTQETRSRGLMERTELAEDAGMLFVFPSKQVLSFWMLNTKIPLDIVFFDESGNFIAGMDMRPCEQEPCPRYTAPEPGVYALEVNKGFRAKHGIGIGWKLDVQSLQGVVNPS